MENSPFPRSHHYLHFILSRGRRQEKVSRRHPMVSVAELGYPAGSLTHPEGGLRSAHLLWVILPRHGANSGKNGTVYASKRKGGFGRWVAFAPESITQRKDISAWLRFEFQDSESPFSPWASGLAWSSCTNPSARKEKDFCFFFLSCPFI